jgi:hypothetical protein
MQHQRAMGYPDVRETIGFCANYLKIDTTPPLAADAMPPDLKQGDQTMPGFRRRPARDELFLRNPKEPDVSLSDLTGGRDEEPSFGSRIGEGLKRTGEGINRASAATQRNTYTGTGHDQDPDNGDMDAHTLLHLVQLCKNGLLSKDEENGTSESDEFLSGLADMLQAHANGNRNGNNNGMDRRRRRPATSCQMAMRTVVLR